MNTIANSLWVTKETARYFVNDLTVLADGNINRDYDDQYVQSGAKVGNTVMARMPQRFTVTDGQALQLQNIYDQTVPVTLTNQKQVAFGYSSAQATTELDSIRQRYVQPGAEALANAAEVMFFQGVYRDIANSVGTPGQTPGTQTLYLQAMTKLTDTATPLRGRKACLDPAAMQTIAGANSNLFNPTAVISENYKMGMFGRQQLGVDEWYQDPAVPNHTTGSFTSCTPVVNGANQTGSTLNTSGWASGATTLNRGDVFTIAGVNSVNPLAYSSNGRLQQFVVKATVQDSGGAIAALAIDPPIITSGQLQTVDVSPAANAAITVLGATSAVNGTLAATGSRQSFVYHPDFATFVMADLVKPSAGAEATVVNSRALRFSIRMVEQYSINTDQLPTRLDMLIGAATLQARLACRIWG